jgi:3-oxoacyl-(acyl-carrier-protein) synthase
MTDIAVVGMVCKLPGANNVAEFWDMLCNKREGLRELTNAELQKLGNLPANYVKAGGFIEDIDLFDAERFGFTAREAMYMDPMHRLWLQACLQALEESGNAGVLHRNVGVYASAGHSTYLNQVILKKGLAQDQYQAALLGNVADCLATRVSHCLDLTGPSLTVQSGCSSSLVALHQARLALLVKQCDVALAGGIALTIPHNQGYVAAPGGFAATDGHCRPFSDDAEGTVFASGYGVVVLKRLAEAVAEGDTIYAVIKGSAINNDGASKASFTAPSVQGQTAVIAKALRVAGVPANTISYVETHGTATPIGDPIELTALHAAYSQHSENWSCHLGSVKANIGHLDVAAGIVGFIKTCLMLQHKTITPQINFRKWNPHIKAGDKFKLAQEKIAWHKDLRRAAVSAFGFGGTNAHVILEEYIAPVKAAFASQSHAIVISAETTVRAMNFKDALLEYLKNNPQSDIAAIAYSLQIGRKQAAAQISLEAKSTAELIQLLIKVTIDDIKLCEPRRILLNKAIELKQGATHSKAVLPAAPLQLQSYWLQEDVSTTSNDQFKQTDIHDWLYQSVWQQIIPTENKFLEALQPILVLAADEHPLKKYFIEHKIKHHWFTSVEELKPQVDFIQPKTCLFGLNKPQDVYIDSLVYLIKTKFFSQLQQFAFLVNGVSDLQNVTPQTELALTIGFCRSIGQEFASIKTQVIDLDEVTQVQNIQTTLCSDFNDWIVWRDKKCWTMTFVKQAKAVIEQTYFKTRGTYLITGGMGNVASVYIEFLAREYQANLILLGRSDFTKVQTKLTALQEKFSHISYQQADVCDLVSLKTACKNILAEHKSIDGIIHIAGAGSDMHYKLLQDLSSQHCQALFAPKLLGVQHINAVMTEFSIPDCIVISSISSALGGVGLSAYAASHNLLDAIVTAQYPHWRVMNWDAWNFHQKDLPEAHLGRLGSEIDKLAIKPEEGLTVLKNSFKTRWQQLYISTALLNPRFEFWARRGFVKKTQAALHLHPRPLLANDYIAANTPLELQLINIWESLLGIGPIGIHDNLFELGGHSLLILELVGCIQQECQQVLTTVDLFAAPTIKQLAEKLQPSQSGAPKQAITKAYHRAKQQRSARHIKTRQPLLALTESTL